MKRISMGFVCILLVWLAALPCALANSWGLMGDLLEAVSADHTWDDYSTLCKQAGNVAVMRSRYHNVLMLADDALYTYTKAVYQPEDKRDGNVKLTGTDNGFILSYGDGERYTFMEEGGAYTLSQAQIGAFSFTAVLRESPEGRYIAFYEGTDGSASAVWYGTITLSQFNIRLFPHTVAEIRHLNLLRAALNSGTNCLGWCDYPAEPGLLHNAIGKGTSPVYAAPFGKSSWRAADGKAAVGLSGELWQLGAFKNADGEAYACIRYDVSPRTQRIGYIRGTVLEKQADTIWEPVNRFLNVVVRAHQATYLTDDPDVSQYPQFQVPKDTQFTCLGMYGNNYAYVTAEVRGGKFVDGGEIVWGFVPLKALSLDEGDDYRSEKQADVMNALAGQWVFYAGGNMAEDVLILDADGSYTGQYLDWDTGEPFMETHGAWVVTKNNPAWNLYWNDPPYELTLIRDDGAVNIKGLQVDSKGFSLTNDEGGGGYMKPEDLP